MVFSGVASQCEECGAMPAGANFEIAATIVPAGTLVPPKRFSVRSVAHTAAFPQSNSVGSVQMQCRMTASLRATATVVFLRPMRLTSLAAQCFSGDGRRTTLRSTLAASNR